MARLNGRLAELAQGVRAGERRAIARALSLVETGGADAEALLAAIHSSTGRAHIVGVTGAPGTGKSTLVNVLAGEYRRRDGQVGVIAVDPTSPYTGGAILGDRIRMQSHHGDPNVFIRSMATRGHLGGLAVATSDAVRVLDAAGFDPIMVETVGAGQSEVEIAGAAHTTLVLLAPGLGDDIQAIKAGILEIADVFVVNKADLAGANHVVAALRAMLSLGARERARRERAAEHRAWIPPIVETVAATGQGMAELAEQVERHRAYLAATGQRDELERARAKAQVRGILEATLFLNLLSALPDESLEHAAARVAAREIDPYQAATELLAQGRQSR